MEQLTKNHAVAISQEIVQNHIFQQFRDQRALHSFPTRRSSDLAECKHHPDRRARSAHRAGHAEDQELRHVLLGALKDRKSTRLNSSHMSISYAVFCLKKKMKPNAKTETRLSLGKVTVPRLATAV